MIQLVCIMDTGLHSYTGIGYWRCFSGSTNFIVRIVFKGAKGELTCGFLGFVVFKMHGSNYCLIRDVLSI